MNLLEGQRRLFQFTIHIFTDIEEINLIPIVHIVLNGVIVETEEKVVDLKRLYPRIYNTIIINVMWPSLPLQKSSNSSLTISRITFA